MTPPEPRRVLIATVDATRASGTTTYTRDLALSLLRHGWLPVVYSPGLGETAELLRRQTIPVVADLSQVGGRPDIIHGHHALETLTAIARFPDVPAVFVCHDALTWHSVPPRLPNIRAYVAVDRNCRDRMVLEHGIPETSARVLTNAIDLQRFQRRSALPAVPKRALVFSNLATETNFIPPIREACEAHGIELDIVGAGSGNSVDRPEELLPRYDVVFAKARCAIEAAAVGTAVIGCDSAGMSGLVTSDRLQSLRELNFGHRTLCLPVTRENVLRELDRYDPADAAVVCDRIRASASVDLLAEQFICLYEELLASPISTEFDHEAFSAALGSMNRDLHRSIQASAGRFDVLLEVLNAPILAPLLRPVLQFRRRRRGR